MSYKRISPVHALFDPNGNMIVIDDKGVIWATDGNPNIWKRYSILPDIPEESVDKTLKPYFPNQSK